METLRWVEAAQPWNAAGRLHRCLTDGGVRLPTVHRPSGPVDTCPPTASIFTSISNRSTPQRKLMFQVTGAFAEFERSMIRQRVRAGLRRAVEQGTKAELEKRILTHLRKGMGILKTAEVCGVGTGTVQRIKAEMPGSFGDANAAA
jgi:Resolvase, N terminal domain